MSYNKSEKHVNVSETFSDFTALNNPKKVMELVFIHLIFVGLIIVVCALKSIKKDQDFREGLFVVLMVPMLYHFICSWFILIKGKLLYNESYIHYEGYTFNFIPWKVKVEIPFADIATAWISEERCALLLSTPTYLTIRKHDNTEIRLNVSYFKKQEVTEFVYHHLLTKIQRHPSSTESDTTPTPLKINLLKHFENIFMFTLTGVILIITLYLMSARFGAGLFFGILLFLFIIIPLLRCIYINIKGKIHFTDTLLHYEGYSFDAFPEKIEYDVPFEEITEAQIWVDVVGGGRGPNYYRDKLLIKKYDNTETLLNICYFNNDDVFEVIYQKMLKHCITNPHPHPKQYEIHISKIRKQETDHFEIFHNEKYISTNEDTLMLTVKTGDILVLKCNRTLQIYRLHDPSKNMYNIEDKTTKS